ncbi:MAG: hypothetical protein ACR2I2_15085 [Bryobacteraceae bacterium]
MYQCDGEPGNCVGVPVRAIAPFDTTVPLAGIDEVTFGVPLSLRGSGEVDISLTVDGNQSNVARIDIV